MLVLAPEHKETEALIRASGVPFTFLRNNWYTENYEQTIQTARATGTLVTSAGEGRVASAPRADFAEAAAVVLTTEGHAGQVYELGGDRPWDFAELAAAFSEVLGRDVELRQVDAAEHTAILESAARHLSRHGYGNLRLEQVARDAGYTRGALYHQFADKDELTLAVLRWVDEDWQREVGALVV